MTASSNIKISALKSSDELLPEIAEGISRLLPQLSSNFSSSAKPTSISPKNSGEILGKNLSEILDSGQCILFIAQDGEILVGSLTLIFYATPSAKRARIEDVVVDENQRGRGIGEILNTAALNAAKDLGVKTVDLTSTPDRKAANGLYKKLGFELRDTNVYRKNM